jgi:hypothetical protein
MLERAVLTLLTTACALLAALFWLGGGGVLLMEVFTWFRHGHWPGWSGLAFLQSVAWSEAVIDWSITPNDWIGAHKLLAATPLPVLLWLCAAALSMAALALHPSEPSSSA